MVNRKIREGIVLGIIVLFVGVVVQPVFATLQQEQELIEVEPKKYLFQTIIDIADDKQVNYLLEQSNLNLFTTEYDYKSLLSKIILRNPRLFFSMIFTKPSMSMEYLDKCYNKGIKITKIIGEENVKDIIGSLKLREIKFNNKINNIISRDKELSDKLLTLKTMNKELKPVTPFKDNPIICSILFMVLLPTVLIIRITEIFYEMFNNIFENIQVLFNIFFLWAWTLGNIYGVIEILFYHELGFDCI